jgi:hypothetical protein
MNPDSEAESMTVEQSNALRIAALEARQARLEERASRWEYARLILAEHLIGWCFEGPGTITVQNRTRFLHPEWADRVLDEWEAQRPPGTLPGEAEAQEGGADAPDSADAEDGDDTESSQAEGAGAGQAVPDVDQAHEDVCRADCGSGQEASVR